MVRRTPGSKPSQGSEPESSANLRSKRPWHSFAPKYFEAGWVPLPLPPRKKSSPPTGTTGKFEMPDKAKIKKWHNDYQANGNIAIRMPDNVIGIDVDAYGEKVGRASFDELLSDLGPLPDTWTLTSRTDGISGIRFFRVPPGLHWSGEPIPDIQIIQNHHRYAVAYPSVHPDTKKIYLWYPPGARLNGSPSGVTVDNEIPGLEDLADLPPAWVEALSGGRMWAALPSDANASRPELLAWVKARPAGEMCRLMRKQAQQAVDEIGVGGAHDALNSRVYSVLSLASEGHSGVVKALREMRQAFYDEVKAPGRKGRRDDRQAIAEFNRVRDGAVRIMMASAADGEFVLEEDCGCAENSLSWGEKLGIVVEEPANTGLVKKRARIGKAKPADKYTYDDSGNAEHLLDIVDGSAYYVSTRKVWYFWDPKGGYWQTDPDNYRIWEIANLVGKRQRELTDEWTDKLVSSGSSVAADVGGDLAGKIGQLSKHAKISSDRRGLENMMKVASVQSRAKRDIADFNRNPRLLGCANGTIELSPDGVVFRPSVRADMLSYSTGVVYSAEAVSPAWESYLARFIPDIELRRYIQEVCGYTLFGGNPERKMFFMQGGTSTGKTTFVNAFNGALGSYAGTMNLSLFRDNQDEKPRPDLVRGVAKRLLSASESSSAWNLHGDAVKRLTGGDPISARDLYVGEAIAQRPAFTPWIATNQFPTMSRVDEAVRRRLVCIPFREKIEVSEEDFTIEEMLGSPDGHSAVLAWAVRGWEMYRAAVSAGKGLDLPAVVQAATQEMFGELSPFDVFLTETVEQTGLARDTVSFSVLYEKYQMWIEDLKLRNAEMTKTAFGRELSDRKIGVKRSKVKGEVNKQHVVRTGIRWV